jgi:general secretion pathway protein D
MGTTKSQPAGVAKVSAGVSHGSPQVRSMELRPTWKSLGVVALALNLVCQAAAEGTKNAGPTDPFLAQSKTASAAPAKNANPFRAAGDRAAGAGVSGATAMARAQSDQALLDARRALSVGDLPRAQQFLGKAQQLKVNYEGGADSPQDVADSIREYQELSVLRNAHGGGAWRTAYSKFLVKQAEALITWNDLDTAARAATEAGQLNPKFNGSGPSPQEVLDKITDLRKHPAANHATTAANGTAAQAPANPQDAKSQTLQLLAQARAALAAGNLAEAQALAGKASALNVPESQFGLNEDRPGKLALDLLKARPASAVQPAAATLPTTSTPNVGDVVNAVAASDANQAMQLGQDTGVSPLALPSTGDAPLAAAGLSNAAPENTSEAFKMLEAGEQALKSGDREGALQSFKAAYEKRDQLDVLNQQRVQGHLQMLQAAPVHKEKLPSPSGELLDSTAAGESVIARQLSAEIIKRQSEATKIRESDPKRSLKMLTDARALINDSEASDAVKQQLLSRLELSIGQTQKYLEDHKSEIDLNTANKETEDEINREKSAKLDVQRRTAQMVEQFNKLVDEHRYAEAEVVAARLYEMNPDDPVPQQINRTAKVLRRERLSQDIKDETEEGVAGIMLNNRQTAAEALAGANTPVQYPRNWGDFKDRKSLSELGANRKIKELEIEQKLRTMVQPNYSETPLTKVVEQLSQVAGINIHLDPRGLAQENVRSDTPVTLNLPQEVSLKSALTLILEPLHLTYSVRDEVLKITSEQIRDGEVFVKTYPVGDLVIPIPNFVPTNNTGLQGLINDAYHAMNGGGAAGVGGPIAVVAGNRPGHPGAMTPNTVNAQPLGAVPSTPNGTTMPLGTGPGSMGGAAMADFDSLIELITSTIEHDSWQENGTGEGEIQSFPTNLSLVVSQTQRVHEQIADLLEQLRRLQDLQVTIEVRFIRMRDGFFERIGVDFDFNIQSKTGLPTPFDQTVANINPTLFDTSGQNPPPHLAASATVGLQPGVATGGQPAFSADLDLPFRQDSFGLTVPQFGTPQTVGNFGFAILSDIEAFFVIQASQGDQRTSVLQAPKVTLFNGQFASVIDSSFRPFVISVIPVVGEFAAAQQPVIVVLSEGTMMSVQAVVSDDRRYVRMTLLPFFSSVGDVQTFTFEGTETTSTSTDSTDSDNANGKDKNAKDSKTTTRSGTTVQLPTFNMISVSTTVSVPDGGTVLLGGIKRLSEGRNEFGVPLLSKVPYIDRLFRNVGIGRETDSLMMMVTPHIIIQEEEEDRLGVAKE